MRDTEKSSVLQQRAVDTRLVPEEDSVVQMEPGAGVPQFYVRDSKGQMVALKRAEVQSILLAAGGQSPKVANHGNKDFTPPQALNQMTQTEPTRTVSQQSSPGSTGFVEQLQQQLDQMGRTDKVIQLNPDGSLPEETKNVGNQSEKTQGQSRFPSMPNDAVGSFLGQQDGGAFLDQNGSDNQLPVGNGFSPNMPNVQNTVQQKGVPQVVYSDAQGNQLPLGQRPEAPKWVQDLLANGWTETSNNDPEAFSQVQQPSGRPQDQNIIDAEEGAVKDTYCQWCF